MGKPINVYGLKNVVGWRLNARDRQNLNVLMAARRTRSTTELLRDLCEREAEAVRDEWENKDRRVGERAS